MIQKNLVALLCLGLVYTTSTAQIIAYFDPHATNKSTDFLQAGNLKIGITSHAGGAINSFIIPTAVGASTTVDIMGNQAETYGRLGQSAIRDLGHSKRYNPTQAGFKEDWGTPRPVQRLDANGNVIATNSPVKLRINSDKVCLWNGDSKFDYIFKNNLVSDVYNDKYNVAATSDEDNIDEAGRGISQGEEITSEFEYSGTYENVMNKIGVTTPVIYHSYNYAFTGNPVNNGVSHAAPFSAMQQFTATGGAAHPTDYTLDPPMPSSTPVYDATQVRDMTVGPNYTPVTGGDKDLNNLWAEWFMRWDDEIFSNSTTYRYKLQTNGTWTNAENRKLGGFVGSVARNYQTAVIISESSSVSVLGRSIGFYRPNSFINKQSIIGKASTPYQSYTRDRTDSVIVQDNGDGGPFKMTAVGFRHFSKGMLNINTLQNVLGNATDYYETYRAECFILYASSPQGVMDAIKAIDTYLLAHSNTFSSTSPLLTIKEDNIELVNGASIYIYPNPVIDIVNIKVTKPTSVNIYSVDGKLVFSKNNVSSNLAIPVNQIGTKGIYFIKTDTETKKLIIAQ